MHVEVKGQLRGVIYHVSPGDGAHVASKGSPFPTAPSRWPRRHCFLIITEVRGVSIMHSTQEF